MDMNNFLPKDGRILRQIREPPALLLWIGLIVFVVGVFTDPFSLSNPKLRLGMAALALSLGWTQLSHARMQSSLTKLMVGLLFLALSGSLLLWTVLPDSWRAAVGRLG